LGFISAISGMVRHRGGERSSADEQSRVLRYVQDHLALTGVVPPVAHLRDELGISIPELRVHLEDIVRQWTLMSALEKAPVAPRPREETPSIGDLNFDSVLNQLLGAPAEASASAGSLATTSSVELSAEVFFNARHSITDEWDGETHAHTWKLLVVATSDQVLVAGGLNAERLREVILSAVAKYEGADLNLIEDMVGLPPTLERMAVQVERDVRRELAHLGGTVVSVALWDKPTTSITLKRTTREAANVDAIQALG
jgi:6-pyruvoyl-tetrahydropterin synthase